MPPGSGKKPPIEGEAAERVPVADGDPGIDPAGTASPGQRAASRARRPYTKRLDSESAEWILRTASASRPATESVRILGHAAAAGGSSIVSVATTSSIGLYMMRSTAGPERTACVA